MVYKKLHIFLIICVFFHFYEYTNMFKGKKAELKPYGFPSYKYVPGRAPSRKAVRAPSAKAPTVKKTMKGPSRKPPSVPRKITMKGPSRKPPRAPLKTTMKAPSRRPPPVPRPAQKAPGIATAQKNALFKVLKDMKVPAKATPKPKQKKQKPANGLYARFKNLFK